MKKLTAIIIIVAIITVLLTACSNGATDTRETVEIITAPKEVEEQTATIENETEATTNEETAEETEEETIFETMVDNTEVSVESEEAKMHRSNAMIIRILEGTPVYSKVFEERLVAVDGELPIEGEKPSNIIFYTNNDERRTVTKEDFTINSMGKFDFVKVTYDGPDGVTSGYVRDYDVIFYISDEAFPE